MSDTGTVVVQCPDISVQKTADAASVSAGDPIGFTITVTNAGPGAATDVTVTDTLPTRAGLCWSISAGSDPGLHDHGGRALVHFGTLAAEATRTVHISSPTTAQSCATINNTATADASNDDPVSDAGTVVVQCPNISVDKTPDAASVSAGETIGFTITVTNAGPGVARRVTLTDTLPAHSDLRVGRSRRTWRRARSPRAC